MSATRSGWFNRPVSRAGCLAGCAVWLALAAGGLLFGLLVLRGELAWQRGPLSADRVWIVNSLSTYTGGDERGLAYAATRPLPGQSCARTRVYFWLWRGQSESLDYCECFQVNPRGEYESAGDCK